MSMQNWQKSFVYAPPLKPFLSLKYYDDDLLVVDKPHGLLSVPGKAVEHYDSLYARLLRVFPTATVVHRLDMATSGVMLFALNKAAHRHLSRQFEKRIIEKHYYALVDGSPKSSTGSVDLPLCCDWPNRPKQMVDHQRGKAALTHYHCVQYYENYSLMCLKPVTGRSHQLRVHMAALGHPILGDRLYASDKALGAATRLCLHAFSIQFYHPHSNQALCFTSELDLQTFRLTGR